MPWFLARRSRPARRRWRHNGLTQASNSGLPPHHLVVDPARGKFVSLGEPTIERSRAGGWHCSTPRVVCLRRARASSKGHVIRRASDTGVRPSLEAMKVRGLIRLSGTSLPGP